MNRFSGGASLVAQTVKNLPAMQETWAQFLGWKDPPGAGNGHPIHYSGLENSMDRGAWRATAHEITKNWTRLSDFQFTQDEQINCCSPTTGVQGSFVTSVF